MAEPAAAAGPGELRALRIRDSLRGRGAAVAVLLCWSVLEAGQTFLLGYALAHAMDDGFLRGHQATGLWWLALAAAGVPVGAYGTARVFGAVAAIVEPLRDRLVRRVVRLGLRDAVKAAGAGRAADAGVVSRLTHQVEIARDAFGGIVMVLRSFAFTAAGVLAGMVALAPVLLLAVLPPLAAGIGLFVAALGPLARRQHRYLTADEAVAEQSGTLAAGLRDITACGARRPVLAEADLRIEAAHQAARALARLGVVRTAALAVGGQLPLVLLLLAGPWLLSTHRITPGALLGAFTYLTQSLQPALQNLVHTLGAAGTRLGVILTRLTEHRPSPRPGEDPVPEERAAPPARQGSVPERAVPPEVRPAAAAGRGPVPGVQAAQPAGQGSVRERAVPPEVPPAAAAGRGPVPEERAAQPAGQGSVPGQAVPPEVPPAAAAGRGPVPEERAAPPAGRTAAAPPTGVAIELRRVTFAYGPGAEPVVRDLDLGVADGEHLAVVGPSGAGKSTLAGLAAGMLRPAGGEVRRARDLVLVPQEAYVFRGSVAENIGYLCGGLTPAEVTAAATAVGAGPLADALGGPAGQVDPATLSAGERQLLALARTFAAPARIVLLDEATCHLDPAAEARAEQAFAHRPATTLIVVAHRISSAVRADRTLVLDGARTVCAPHAELRTLSPLYRDLTAAWAPSPTRS
jgi:ATP-binding cassette subfamily C protein